MDPIVQVFYAWIASVVVSFGAGVCAGLLIAIFKNWINNRRIEAE